MPLDTVVWKYFICCYFSSSELLLVLSRNYDAGVAALVEKSYGYYFIILFYIVGNVNIDLSWSSVVQVHTQIIMDFSSGDFHFLNLVLLLFLEVLYQHKNFLWKFCGVSSCCMHAKLQLSNDLWLFYWIHRCYKYWWLKSAQLNLWT